LECGELVSPIIVWRGIIVDGHNRYRIIQKHPQIIYQIHEVFFESRQDAIIWICKNQLGRRNLTPEQKKYVIGKQYEAEKANHGGDRKSAEAKSNVQNEHSITSERIAQETGTSASYVRRAEHFAKGLDLAEEALPGIRQDILSGQVKVTEQEITELAKADADMRAGMVEELHKPKKIRKRRSKEEIEQDKKKLQRITQISEDMLEPRGNGSPRSVLYELNAAADDLIFRWCFCIQEHPDYYATEEVRTGLKEIMQNVSNFFQALENGKFPDSPLNNCK